MLRLESRSSSRSLVAICTIATLMQRSWAKAALDDLFSNRWPAIVGFCWWNEGWQNDDHKKHDTDMIVLHDVNLSRMFREELAQHRDKIQEAPLIAK